MRTRWTDASCPLHPTGTSPVRQSSGRSSGVEHNLAKVGVEGSNPFARSNITKSYRNLPIRPSRTADSSACYTILLHNQGIDDPLSALSDAVNRGARCSTRLLHNGGGGLVERAGWFHYRRRVPDALQAVVGRCEIWRSLHTDILEIALSRARRLAADMDAEFSATRIMLGVLDDVVPKLSVTMHGIDLSAALADRLTHRFEQRGSDRAATASEPSLGDVYRQYLSDPRHDRCHRTSEAYRTTERWIAEFFGADTPIGAISRERCRAFVDFLMSVPKNANKKYPNLTLAEAVAATAHDPNVPRINAANVNAYLNKFAGAMNWAELEGLIARNPAKGLRIPDRVKRRDKRRPFSAAQLLRIFRAPLFTGCIDDEHGYARRGRCHPRRARFWVPLIALFSGLRLNEICQLDVADIIELDGVPCFTVRSGLDDDGGQKRVKNLASERVVPIHIDLRRIGLCRFVTGQQSIGHTKLFPEIAVGSNGYRSKNFSQWFSRFLTACGAREPLTCFHSFRHCFRDGLRASGVSRDISLALGGWANGSSSGDVADAYGSGFPTRLLEDGINRIRFAGLDLSHLIDQSGPAS